MKWHDICADPEDLPDGIACLLKLAWAGAWQVEQERARHDICHDCAQTFVFLPSVTISRKGKEDLSCSKTFPFKNA